MAADKAVIYKRFLVFRNRNGRGDFFSVFQEETGITVFAFATNNFRHLDKARFFY